MTRRLIQVGLVLIIAAVLLSAFALLNLQGHASNVVIQLPH